MTMTPMTTEHTPGPWTLSLGTLPGATQWKVRGGDRLVATLRSETEGEADLQERAQANAALISAAPDLLAALKATLTPLIRLGDFVGNEEPARNGLDGYDRCAIIGAVRAAIARAEKGD